MVPESNRRWATDLTTTWTRRDGLAALVPVIDCGDRVALGVEVMASQEAPAVLAPLSQALEGEFGAPDAVPEGLELLDLAAPPIDWGIPCASRFSLW